MCYLLLITLKHNLLNCSTFVAIVVVYHVRNEEYLCSRELLSKPIWYDSVDWTCCLDWRHYNKSSVMTLLGNSSLRI